MFHDGGKHESGYERNGQRIGHGFIMFFETVFKDVQAEALVKVLEENLSQVVTFLDDDGILRTQFVEVGKCRIEHRVGRYITEAAVFIELL